MTNQTVTINSTGMTTADVIAVARHDAKIVISAEALAGMAKTRAHIEALCRAKLAGYKRPKEVRFIAFEEFPRSTTGKIQRHAMEAWLTS